MDQQENKENKSGKLYDKKSKGPGNRPSMSAFSVVLWVLILLGALAAIRIFGSLATLLGFGAGWLVLNDLSKKGKSRKMIIIVTLLSGLAAALVSAVLLAFLGIAI